MNNKGVRVASSYSFAGGKHGAWSDVGARMDYTICREQPYGPLLIRFGGMRATRKGYGRGRQRRQESDEVMKEAYLNPSNHDHDGHDAHVALSTLRPLRRRPDGSSRPVPPHMTTPSGHF